MRTKKVTKVSNEFDIKLVKRTLKFLVTRINLLKSDAALLRGDEKEKIEAKIIEYENKKGEIIIELRKNFLKLSSRKLRHFLLHKHPEAFIMGGSVPFVFNGPNYCNYIVEALVLSYVHDACKIAFDSKDENDQLFADLSELLKIRFKINLFIRTMLTRDQGLFVVNNFEFKAIK